MPRLSSGVQFSLQSGIGPSSHSITFAVWPIASAGVFLARLRVIRLHTESPRELREQADEFDRDLLEQRRIDPELCR
jgi:hypothetical protein